MGPEIESQEDEISDVDSFSLRSVIVWLLVISTITLVLSGIWQIPYLVSVIGLFVWSCLGHIITLDDDLPGGWSNPENDPRVLWYSLAELFIKLITVIILFWLMHRFPELAQYGASGF